ncbi:ATP-binding cassette, subfamily C, CydD/ATP-binding cassette, subfamily C, CydCD [Amycolatopsis arida]|uniref:ATP-binding cassette, subfamily C, CydD/ATP-binding cassette, subfamily C, CydCD n=1 Tax=Amycolatopsis arida TaxID=587909 RepID=A0A1I5YMT0_9PSEU|nr:thiol reductant ABC exporter subunit CydD [Amycolatopsis arida]TDX90630.1 ATP-binding cassette subfamily C protein CydD/ATP-binding cassette subfamily C protein CydCD [Amycolatopsis arida]SFQ45462.1 ATP-binding cassette, subfamily C, CydD/ATP-binding cassette, subfamily C, CydCD [Amycolatopsis arida]
MSFPARALLPATVSTADTARAGKGPLGALPALSAAARRALAATAGLALLNAAALVAQAFLLAHLLAGIASTVDSAATGRPDLDPTAALLAGTVVARAVLTWASRTVAARAAADTKEELRAKVLDHALRLGPEWIAARGPGQLTALTTRGLDALDAYFTEYLPALVTAAVVPVAAGAAVLLADWPSAVVIAVTVPLLPAFAVLVGRYTADRITGATDAAHRLSGHLLELVRALPVLAAFRRAEAQAETVRRTADRHRRATLATLRVAFTSAFVLELAATLAVGLVAVLVGVRLVSGDLSLAVGLGVLILAPECYQPLRAVGAAFHASQDGVEAVRRVADVLAEPVPRPGTARPRRGEVRVAGLRVRRRGAPAPDGESFVARPGTTVRLAAPSGAGKSTTLAVLLGFVRPDAGTVTVAGTPLADLDMSTWREALAWVPQFPAFTGGTVRAELELAGAPEDDVRDLLVELDLHHLRDAPVHRLSTGQRQRVAVARALLRVRRGAWLLLLDEPTAHQDPEHARMVLAAVRRAERAGAAVVLAAHRAGPTGDAGDVPAAPRPGVPPEGTGGTPARAPLPLRALLDRRLLAGAGLAAAALLAGLALTATSGWLIAKAAQQPPILTLTVAVVGVRTFGLARAALRYVERLVTHDGALRVATRLRVGLWRSLVHRGPIADRGDATARRLVDDVDTVRDLLPRVLAPPLVAALVLAGVGVTAVAVLPAAGLAAGAPLLAGALLAPAVALVTERRATSALAEGRREVAARVLALLDQAAELLAFGAHRRHRADLARADRGLAATARRRALGAGAADAVVVLATGGAMLAGTATAAAAVTAGALDPTLVPVLGLVPLALAEVLALLPPAAAHWDTLRRARTRLTDLDPTVKRHEGGLHGVGGEVELRGVDVRWPGASRVVLRGVDLRVPAGSRVAVVGPSGAGKSTLLAVLLGLLDPERGEVVRPARVAWAPQEPRLVATTVAENLRMADPHVTDAELVAALRVAGLPDLPLDIRLGSGGAGLSGGQAQRVALARAVLAAADGALVLLDEPTAHLDEPTARTVLARLDAALAGRTVLHVTHRAAEAAGADLVVEVRDGRVRSLRPEEWVGTGRRPDGEPEAGPGEAAARSARAAGQAPAPETGRVAPGGAAARSA